MIKALRKRHLQVWSAWAILLPVGIVSAYIVVPKEAANKLLQPASSQALPVIIKTIDKKNYTATLRKDSASTQLQLEWKNKAASIYPSSLIYQLAPSSDNIVNAGIVGRVEARGDYYFPLKADSNKNLRFVLYDIIHQQKIDSINF